MANGDAASTAGLDIVAGTDDRRNGYDEINKTRDYLVTHVFSASQVPNLAASKITSGAFDAARIPSLDASKIATGTLNAARIPSLDASKIATGTLNAARLNTYTGTPIADAIPLTSASGTFAVATPTSGSHPATKAYVDDAVSGASLADGPTTAAYNRSATGSGYRSTWMNSANQFMYNTSSRRYKKGIKAADRDALLATVEALRVVTYLRRGKDTPDTPEVGLIAEEAVNLVPDVVFLDAEGRPEGLNYEMLTGYLIGAVQSLAARVAVLEGI